MFLYISAPLSPIDNYCREDVPPSACIDTHSFLLQCWRLVDYMGFNGTEEESPPLSGWDANNESWLCYESISSSHGCGAVQREGLPPQV